ETITDDILTAVVKWKGGKIIYLGSRHNTGKTESWGAVGHSLVAQIAQTFLTDSTDTFAKDLLPWFVYGNLSSLSSWPDNILYENTNPVEYVNWAWSRELHYVNTPDWLCHYVPVRDCVAEKCIDGSIQNYTRRLADTRLDFVQRQEALQFLVHFLGDIHQPLHAGFSSDRGGNDLTVDLTYHKYADNITQWSTCPTSDQSQFSACSTTWIQEDNDLNCNTVYIDEDGNHLNNLTKFHLNNVYFNRVLPIMEQRLIQAGVRLGKMLILIEDYVRTHKYADKTRLCGGTIALIIILVLEGIIALLIVCCWVCRRNAGQKYDQLT
ncbi:unnamed protein product, partial [Didymodactylos carnosus]